MKKGIICALTALVLVGAMGLAACESAGESFTVELGYNNGVFAAEDGSPIGGKYDESLFYRNDLTLKNVADPGVMYDGGKLWLYGTSNYLSNYGIAAWSSSDGIHWDSCGVAFEPALGSWSYSNLWAPEVVHDDVTGKYFMTYSARNCNTIVNGTGPYYGNTYIGLAVADSPQGPFKQWTGTNGNGDEITLGDPIFDPAKITAMNGVACEEGFYARYRFLDSSLYTDRDGEKYIYFSRGQDRYKIFTEEDYFPEMDNSEIYVVKCKNKDFATPDYSTVTQLTCVYYNTVDDTSASNRNSIEEERADSSNKINEAPQMLERDGKYYLTFSVGGTSSNLYSVMQAVGDSPMGPFTKLDYDDGGLVLGTEISWTQMAGTAHHAFVEIGDELFIFYHTGADRYVIDTNNRVIAYDRAGFVENGKGEIVLASNGPTGYAIQPLAEAFSGYKNIAGDAKISATGLAAGSDVKYLNDGFFASHLRGAIRETEFNAGETVEITLDFSDYRTVTALMLYNSIDYDKTFYQIAYIELDVKTEGGAKGKATVSNAAFSFDDSTRDGGMQLMFAGSNLTLDFNDILVKQIKITFRAPRSEGYVAIGDIVVLGK